MGDRSSEQIAFELVETMRGPLGIEQALLTALFLVYGVLESDAPPVSWLREFDDETQEWDEEHEGLTNLLTEALNLVGPEFARLGPERLSEMSGLVSGLTETERIAVFERLLDQHGKSAGRAGGAHRTPRWVADLVGSLVSLSPGNSILDPACGYGDMLLASSSQGQQIAAMDISSTARMVCQMRFTIHGLAGSAQEGDFLQDWNGVTDKFDSVVVSPPWGLRPSTKEVFDLPSTASIRAPLDLAWFATALEVVSPDGRVFAHLPTGVVDRDRDVAALMKFAERGQIEAIIRFGRGASSSTDIPSVLIVARQTSAPESILMLDATSLGSDQGRGSVSLSENDIDKLSHALNRFRESDTETKAQYSENGLARAVSVDEISELDRPTLNPRTFVEAEEGTEELPSPKRHLLTELRVEGFKPFRNPISAPLAPITLIYGQNSAGKSSLMQALLLLKQSLAANRFVADGEVTRLGSFGAMINSHDVSRPLRLGVTFGVPVDWHEYGLFLNPKWQRSFDFEFSAVNSADVRLSSVECGLGPEHSVAFRTDDSRGPLLLSSDDAIELTKFIATSEARWRAARPGSKRGTTGPYSFRERRVSDVKRVLRQVGESLPMDEQNLVPSRTSLDLRTFGREGATVSEGELAASALEGSLGVVEASGKELSRLLSEAQYLGPLRSAPERVYPRRGGDGGVGTAGENLAVYLFEQRAELEEINRWLLELQMPYRLDVSALETGTGGHAVGDLVALLLTDLRSGAVVSTADVGFGISQVLPVIVQLLANRRTVVAIEQPEIHLHPGLQTRFADLLIESSKEEGAANQVIVETHSEHLMLRLQRRIREGELDSSDVSVLYVDWNEDETAAEVIQLPLAPDGSFKRAWPNGFFAERLTEIFGGSTDQVTFPTISETDAN